MGERAWAYFCNITFRVCYVWNFPEVLSQQYQCWYFPWRQSEQPESASLQIPVWLGSGILFEVGTGCLGYSKEHHCLEKATKHEAWKCLLFPCPQIQPPFALTLLILVRTSRPFFWAIGTAPEQWLASVPAINFLYCHLSGGITIVSRDFYSS